jgi:arginase
MKPIFIFIPYRMGDFDPALAGMARHTWWLVTPPLPEASPTVRMGALCQAVAAEVATIRAEGHLPVVMAGDCTISMGVLAGLQQETPDLTLIWYDAHGDFNTHETTPSGFIGGMPLAMLCGRGEQTIVEGAGAKVHPEAAVILTDARDLDPGEREALASSAVVHLPDVAELLALDLPDKPIYIHFDGDVLRLEDMAAVNYPAQGGSDLATIEASLTRLAQTGRVVAVSVTMWNPELDEEGQAEQVVMGLVERWVEQL